MNACELNFNVHTVLHCVQVAITLSKEYRTCSAFSIMDSYLSYNSENLEPELRNQKIENEKWRKQWKWKNMSVYTCVK